MSKKDLIDDFLGMVISNLLYREGIRLVNIKNYSDEELWLLIRTFEKSRLWSEEGGGIRVTTWESFLRLSQEILDYKRFPEIQREILGQASIVMSLIALEECVNSFIQSCLIAKGLSQTRITGILEKKDLSKKLDGYLKALTGHSLKDDQAKLWETFQTAKKIRNETIHNKLVAAKFSDDDRLGRHYIFRYTFAKDITKAVRAINEYLQETYPHEYVQMEKELNEIWKVVKKRLDLNSSKLKGVLI